MGGPTLPPLIWRVYPAECAQSQNTAHMDTGARLLERAHKRKAKLVPGFTTLGILAEFQEMMAEPKSEPG